jgi:hypothetical protein
MILVNFPRSNIVVLLLTTIVPIVTNWSVLTCHTYSNDIQLNQFLSSLGHKTFTLDGTNELQLIPNLLRYF